MLGIVGTLIMSIIVTLQVSSVQTASATSTNATVDRFGLYQGENLRIVSIASMFDLAKWQEVESQMNEGFQIGDVVVNASRIFVILQKPLG
jgi:hypothetical protein